MKILHSDDQFDSDEYREIYCAENEIVGEPKFCDSKIFSVEIEARGLSDAENVKVAEIVCNELLEALDNDKKYFDLDESIFAAISALEAEK